MNYTVNWEEYGVLVSFAGEVSHEINASANHEVYMNPRSDDIKYMIWDLTRVTKTTYTELETKSSALRDKLTSHRLPKIKMGFVTNDVKIAFICDNYILHSIQVGSQWEFNISDSFETIKRWVEN